MSTHSIINSIFSTLGLATKPTETFYKEISKSEIDKIIIAQRKQSRANDIYSNAGFPANNITSKMVQNQIAGA